MKKMDNENLISISKNKDGNYYFIYKVRVQRGIKGKTKSVVDELIIVGIPKNKFNEYCKKNNINVVTRP